MDNYRISRDRAQAYFLGFDQEQMIRTWNLSSDAQWIHVSFLGRPYAISRADGRVIRSWEGTQAEHSEVLSIFDLLCHDGGPKIPSGTFAPVNSLRGAPRTGGVETNFHSRAAARFHREPDAFRRACLSLGAAAVDMGDIGFRFPLFGELEVILKFYYADEDFPASVTLLWDSSLLQFVFYETVFYIAGCLMGAIGREMDFEQSVNSGNSVRNLL